MDPQYEQAIRAVVREVYRLLKQGPKTRSQLAAQAEIEVALPLKLSHLLIVVLHHMVERGKIEQEGTLYYYIEERSYEGEAQTVWDGSDA